MKRKEVAPLGPPEEDMMVHMIGNGYIVMSIGSISNA